MIHSINSAKAEPAFGKKYTLLIECSNPKKAIAAAKEIKPNSEYLGTSIFKGAFGDNLHKFLFEGDWASRERNLAQELRKGILKFDVNGKKIEEAMKVWVV